MDVRASQERGLPHPASMMKEVQLSLVGRVLRKDQIPPTKPDCNEPL